MLSETVLIADDSPLMCDRLEDELLELGVGTCVKVANGQAAVRAYEKQRADLVFMDINMPVLDGLQALEALRAMDPQAYVVIASGVSHVDKVKAAIRLGAKGYLVKPYSAGKIAEVIAQFRKERAAAAKPAG